MVDKKIRFLEQVQKLYHRYGIKSVTMDEVAKHLCISKKTLYEHFTDKEDLVKSVLLMDHSRRNHFFTEIKKKNLNAIEEILEFYKMINTMFKDYNPSMEYDIRKYYPDLYSKIKEIRRKRMYDTIYGNMNKGKKESLYRKELNSGIIARLHVIRVESMFDNDMFSVEELISSKVFNEIFVYHMQGILNPNGRVIFEKIFKQLKADNI